MNKSNTFFYDGYIGFCKNNYYITNDDISSNCIIVNNVDNYHYNNLSDEQNLLNYYLSYFNSIKYKKIKICFDTNYSNIFFIGSIDSCCADITYTNRLNTYDISYNNNSNYNYYNDYNYNNNIEYIYDTYQYPLYNYEIISLKLKMILSNDEITNITVCKNNLKNIKIDFLSENPNDFGLK